MKTNILQKITTNLILSFIFVLCSINNIHAQIINLNEGFEETSDSILPSDWGCNYYSQITKHAAGSQDDYQKSGSRSAFLFPKTNQPEETGYLVTPLVAAGTWTISFWVKQTSGVSETYTVGICDDQSGLNFTTNEVLPDSFTGSTIFTLQSFTLSFTTNKYIAISTGAGNIDTLAIDDISITGTPLPVELIEFSVYNNNNNKVKLHWVTATETNNYGFDIEKSLDLKVWTKITFVAGAGNSNQILEYNYTDLTNENNNTIIYYRLKQIDFNGVYKYSDIRSLSLNSSNQEDMSVVFTLYPNPASQNINIICNQPTQQFEVRIFNQNGLLTCNYLMQGSIKLDVSILKPAVYQIVLFNKANGKQYHYKFVKISD